MILTHRPVPHTESQGFGANPTWNNPHPVFDDYQSVGHLATDFSCPIGTPIAAAAPGVVVYAGWGQNMPEWIATKYGYIFGPGGWASGIITILDHGDGTATAYSHQSEVLVSAGQRVAGGQTIGLSGKTGRSTGPHLHFEYMTLPINYGSAYYSRLDPMKQYSGGIQVVGGITPTPLSKEGFLMALTDQEQRDIYKWAKATHDRTTGGIPAGPARDAQQIGQTPRLADSGDIWDIKQLLAKTLNTDGGNVLLAAIAEGSGKTIQEVTKHAQAVADVDRQYIPERSADLASKANKDTDPAAFADAVLAGMGTELAEKLVTALINRLTKEK